MRILIVNTGIIPVKLYGGTERVIYSLGKELVKLGHDVTYLVKEGSYSDFAKVLFIDTKKTVIDQIPNEYDVVHFNFVPDCVEKLHIPYIITQHGNPNDFNELDRNTVFVSKNHAQRYNSNSYVYNGLDWSEYMIPDFNKKKDYYHFLGKAAWRVKNVKGAIDTILRIKNAKLKVLGGVRFNFKMGIRFTFSPRISFEGMVGGIKKEKILNESKGLIFPVKWHEPFGLAIIESLYYGCPVFGTPYGSLPELVNSDVGFLSNCVEELSEAVVNSGSYSSQRCHEYALDEFNSKKMALQYLKKYEIVLNKGFLNEKRPVLQDHIFKNLEWR